MSLQSKLIDQITFDDIQAFYDARIAENIRIDYKADWPDKLSKEIAAFANTYGGLLLVGIQEDPVTRTPASIPGVKGDKSATERVVQAGQSLWPPVLAEASDPIPVPDKPGRSVYVVRVQQSCSAPHVDVQKDRVHIRTGDVSHPISNADVDRIALMLRDRDRWDQKRNDLVSNALSRFLTIRGGQLPTDPYLWISFCPEYPVGEVATVACCHESAYWRGNTVRVAAGAMSSELGNGNVETMRLVTTFGNTFDLDTRLSETTQQNPLRVIHLGRICYWLRKASLRARDFYKRAGCEFFGPVRLSVSAERMRGCVCSFNGWFADHPIVDVSFGAEALTDSTAITAANYDSLDLTDFEYEIVRQLCPGLGVQEFSRDALKVPS